MLCQVCNKNAATIHYKSSVNGNVTEKYLCNECAEKYGMGAKSKTDGLFHTVDMADSFFDNSGDALLGGLFGELLGTRKQPAQTQTVCKGCGMRYADFAHGGKIGCEKCYETFEGLLYPTLKRIHGNTVYCGKVPKGFEKQETLQQKIEALQQKLNEAVINQEYEKAAQYRDEIRELENKEQNNSGEEK